MAKSSGNVEFRPEGANWTEMYVQWSVVYNPDQNVDVEGSTIVDQFYKGSKRAVSYVTDDESRPFKVMAYAGKGTVDEVTGVFTPAVGDEPILVKSGWDGVTVQGYQKKGADGKEQLASWTWQIPEKSKSLDENTHYTYVITYWTKVERSKAIAGGYIRNQVAESFAGLTRDRTKNIPGDGDGTDSPIKVTKRYLEDEYIKGEGDTPDKSYTKWEITFDRRSTALEAAIAEDTLPHISYNGQILADTFVEDTEGEHRWKVDGLGDGEVCVPVVSQQGYDVEFWFYTQYSDDGNEDNDVEGLRAIGDGYSKEIKITYWTDNSIPWLKATSEGKLSAEHWNKVHLVLDGHED
ncbi:MAG: hypothetical protein J6D53_14725, partial [Blautia sp.]|nr:hypothetical protein [Blautia sp.]